MFFSVSAYGQCTYDVVRQGCQINIICSETGERISQIPLIGSSAYDAGSSIQIRHSVRTWYNNITKINGYATNQELLDSISVWQNDCSAGCELYIIEELTGQRL